MLLSFSIFNSACATISNSISLLQLDRVFRPEGKVLECVFRTIIDGCCCCCCKMSFLLKQGTTFVAHTNNISLRRLQVEPKEKRSAMLLNVSKMKRNRIIRVVWTRTNRFALKRFNLSSVSSNKWGLR